MITAAMPTDSPRRSSGRSQRTHFYGYPESHRQERIFINIGSYRMSAAKKKAAEAVVYFNSVLASLSSKGGEKFTQAR
jgi:hypothetical protein